jgi:hypothetical protein
LPSEKSGSSFTMTAVFSELSIIPALSIYCL